MHLVCNTLILILTFLNPLPFLKTISTNTVIICQSVSYVNRFQKKLKYPN